MKIDPSTSIALASVIVAICALAATIWQGQQNYKHNQLKVRPILTAKTNDTGNSFTLQLANSGVGPAIIKDFVLLFEGKEVSRNNWKTHDDFLESKTKEFKNVRAGKYASGTTMQVGEDLQLLSFEYDTNQDISFVDDLDLQVNYQGIYQDETFTYDSREDRKSHGQ